jgi:hypothetical protein
MANAFERAVSPIGANYFHSFFHPEEGYEAAEAASNHGYEEGQKYLEPYNQHGMDQYGRLNDATGALLNPEELENKWANNYQTSPYAKRMLEQNMGNGLDEASAMGLLGSSGAQRNIQTNAGDIVSRDRREYLNSIMQKYMAGIGLGQSLYGTGANAGGALSTNAINQGRDTAGLEYGRTNAPGELFGKFAGAAASFAGGGLPGLATYAGGNAIKGNTNAYNQ